MPIYEYQCDGCQEVFEVRQRMTDPAPKQHTCGSTVLHRVLSATSFVLKGTGWYATDYGNRSAPPPEGGESDAKGEAKAAEGQGGHEDNGKGGGKDGGQSGDASKAAKGGAAPGSGHEGGGAKSGHKAEATSSSKAAPGGTSKASGTPAAK